MDKFIKYGSFLISLAILLLVWYDVYQNKKLREAQMKKASCTCTDHNDTPDTIDNIDFQPTSTN